MIALGISMIVLAFVLSVAAWPATVLVDRRFGFLWSLATIGASTLLVMGMALTGLFIAVGWT